MISKIAKFLIKTFLGLSIILTLTFIYQEVSNRNSYNYLSLWKVKTREKIFTKGTTTVHLVGMIHIASQNYYKDILMNAPLTFIPDKGEIKPNSVVTLMEGITDKNNLKKEQPPLNYESFSQLLGLASQNKFYDQFPNPTLADVDYSEIPHDLRTDIGLIGKAMEQFYLFANKKITANEVKAFFNENETQIQNLSMNENSQFDSIILGKRNDYLWNKIKDSENKYKTIVVPWGARHLPDIEHRLVQEGYILKETTTYEAVNLISVLKTVSPWVSSLIYSFYLE